MKEFIDFFGSAHLNSKNVAAYSNENGVLLTAENIANGKKLGSLQFESYENAEHWFSSLEGINNASRLGSALDILESL